MEGAHCCSSTQTEIETIQKISVASTTTQTREAFHIWKKKSEWRQMINHILRGGVKTSERKGWWNMALGKTG